MPRWLDVLGPLKWPSILLVLSPVVAYPFWAKEPEPMSACGPVLWRGQVFEAYAPIGTDEVVLRPMTRGGDEGGAAPRTISADVAPMRHDPGAIVIARPSNFRCMERPQVGSQRSEQ